MRSASSPATPRPVRIMSIAWLWPMRRGRRTVPRSTSGTPQRRQKTPKTASVAATRRSHQSASSRPPATAYPSTAARTGFPSSMRVGPMGPSPSSLMRLSAVVHTAAPRRSWPEATAFRSAPAQNVPPAPVSTATASPSSASKRRNASTSTAAVGSSTALRTSGRLMVTTATSPSVSNRTVLMRPPSGRWLPPPLQDAPPSREVRGWTRRSGRDYDPRAEVRSWDCRTASIISPSQPGTSRRRSSSSPRWWTWNSRRLPCRSAGKRRRPEPGASNEAPRAGGARPSRPARRGLRLRDPTGAAQGRDDSPAGSGSAEAPGPRSGSLRALLPAWRKEPEEPQRRRQLHRRRTSRRGRRGERSALLVGRLHLPERDRRSRPRERGARRGRGTLRCLPRLPRRRRQRQRRRRGARARPDTRREPTRDARRAGRLLARGAAPLPHRVDGQRRPRRLAQGEEGHGAGDDLAGDDRLLQRREGQPDLSVRRPEAAVSLDRQLHRRGGAHRWRTPRPHREDRN